MARKRIARKELLSQTDEFITLTQRVLNFVAAYLNYFIIGALVVLIVLLGVVGTRYYLIQKAKKAANAYAEALAEIPESIDKNNPADTRAIEAAIQALEQVRKSYANSAPGRNALLDLGALYYHLDQYAKAREAYQTYLQDLRPEEEDLRPLLLDSLAHTYEAENKPAEAVSLWEKITHLPQGFLKEEAWFNLGRVYETMNQPDKAREAYQKLIEQFPESANIKMAKTRLQQLSR